MTRMTKLTLCALLALTPALAPTLASAQSAPQVLIQRHGGGDPVAPGFAAVPPRPAAGIGGLVAQAGNAPTAAGDNSVFCGNGEMFYWYEEDADGNEIEGTRQYGCDYD
ncbi:hypothetical protein HKCCE4037_18070 [Rhodobacterales bacterium HKCCE4037]|nr:hypothetical protein [Rhodobacterales bacterium HKCCE4037]